MADHLDAHGPPPGPVELDEEDALPRPERQLTLMHRDRLRVPEHHREEVAVRVGGLLR